MTDPSQVAPEHDADAPETPPAVEASILGALRQARAKIGAGSDPLHLDVPGYDEKLVVRYKWVPLKDLSRTSQQLSKMTEPSAQAIAAAADALVATCEEVEVRLNDKLLPLATDSIPITFGDERLAYALGFPKPDSARDMAVRVFNNEYALIEQAADVVEWLKDTTKKVDTAALGE